MDSRHPTHIGQSKCYGQPIPKGSKRAITFWWRSHACHNGGRNQQGSSLKTHFFLSFFFFKPQMSKADFNLHAGRWSIGITKIVYEFFDGLALEMWLFLLECRQVCGCLMEHSGNSSACLQRLRLHHMEHVAFVLFSWNMYSERSQVPCESHTTKWYFVGDTQLSSQRAPGTACSRMTGLVRMSSSLEILCDIQAQLTSPYQC